MKFAVSLKQMYNLEEISNLNLILDPDQFQIWP